MTFLVHQPDNLDYAAAIALSPDHQAIFQTQTITATAPGTILPALEIALEAIARGVPLSGKLQHIVKDGLWGR